MVWHEIFPRWLTTGDPLTPPLVPPWAWHLWDWVKCLKSYFIFWPHFYVPPLWLIVKGEPSPGQLWPTDHVESPAGPISKWKHSDTAVQLSEPVHERRNRKRKGKSVEPAFAVATISSIQFIFSLLFAFTGAIFNFSFLALLVRGMWKLWAKTVVS